MRLDELQAQSGWVRETSPQLGFDRRTIQLVLAAISRAPNEIVMKIIIFGTLMNSFSDVTTSIKGDEKWSA
jgi:hypothetical protein